MVFIIIIIFQLQKSVKKKLKTVNNNKKQPVAGKPKGIVRPTGGHAVVLPYTMKASYCLDYYLLLLFRLFCDYFDLHHESELLFCFRTLLV